MQQTQTKVAHKDIRSAVNAKFLELAPKRIAGEFGEHLGTLAKGNTAFRKAVINWAEAEFGITHSAGTAHYNFAFKQCKASNPDLVVGLGRADDKKGGRKRKAVAEQPAAIEPAVVEPAATEPVVAEAAEPKSELATTPKRNKRK